MNLNFWPKMYYSGGGGGGGGSGGGGGGASGGGGAGGGGATGGAGYGGGAGAGGGAVGGGGAAGEQSPEEPTPVGAFRFNTDTAKLEYYDGNQWVNITTDSPDRHTGGTRGLWFGGATPSDSDRIDFVNIDSAGNAVDFGDITAARHSNGDGGMASKSRGFYARGSSPITGRIEFVTFASQGDGTDFGDMKDNITNGQSSASDQTRGILFGGYAAPATLNTIQYITMASSGNGVDFGDLRDSGSSSSFGSPTRAITVDSGSNIMEYVTISTLGNAADFGDSTLVAGHRAYASNAIRGVSFGAELSPSGTKTSIMEFATIATLGSAADFGDTISAIAEGSACSSPTRAVYGGGITPSYQDVIQSVQIMTRGDAQDFGDLTQARGHLDGCSNGHGGLG